MKLSSLLEKTSRLEIFKHYLPSESNFDEDCIKIKGVRPGRNILSPFVKEKNPSFSIYQEGDNLKYKCWASGPAGDVFQFVADLKQIDCKANFNEVLEIINRDMKLGLENKKTRYQSPNWKAEYYEGMNKKAKDFWLSRNITEETLEKFGVRQMKKLTYKSPSTKKSSQFDYHKDGFVAFEFTVNGRKKLYMPTSVNPHLKKKNYSKTQTNADIFGLRQLPKSKQKYLLICEGESDVLCAVSHGIPAVCFQSANSHITKQQIRLLRQKASNLLICYDLDEAGRKAIKKLTWDFPSLINIDIPKDSTGYIVTQEVLEDLKLDKKELGKIKYELPASDKTKIVAYKDISDWLPNAYVADFKFMIDTEIKAARKNQFLHIWERGTSYMKFNTKNGEQEMVSNFIIEADAQIIKEEGSLRLVRFISRSYKTNTLAVPSDIFNSPDKLSDYLTRLRGNFRFNGNKKDLICIQQMTFDFSDCLEEIQRMGWNKKNQCFILSNAALNGSIETPNSEGILHDMYIPVANNANAENSTFATDAKFRMLDDSKIKEPWQFFDIITKHYGPQVATMVFSFLFSSLFFDWIARKGVSNWFVLLGVFGQKGCGKGSLIKLLMKLFTSDPEEVSLTNTTKTGFVRTMEQASNIPAWLDEFRNTISLEKIEALKNIYDLIGKVIGVRSNDSRTKRSKILRPAFLSGQESPVNEALFSRLVSINLPLTEKTPQQIKEFSKDMGELDKGIGQVLFKLLGFRNVVIENFKEKYFELVEFLGDAVAEKGAKANIRLLNNYAAIIAPLIIAIENGLKLSRDGTKEKEIIAIKKYAVKTLLLQAAEESELDEVNKFIELLMICATQAKPILFPGHDFCVHENADGSKELVIKSALINQFNNLYKTVYRQEGPDQSAIKKYIQHKPYFKGRKKAYFYVTGADNNSKNASKSQLHAIVLDIEKLPEETKGYFLDLLDSLKKKTVNAIAN